MADYEQHTLKEYDYWTLFLHGNQYYLGRAYVWLNRPGEMQRLSSLAPAARDELFGTVLSSYEFAVAQLFGPEHMNYAWLGNDFSAHQGHGHMHLIPRYSRVVQFCGREFRDERWGKNYAPSPALELPHDDLFAIRDAIRRKLI
jgi:diadenosine tetraphosphate (Ap4A) HIT family hydrolase